jgi:UDP-N-acetylglucosamine transferase subunit ALG13
VTTPDSIPARRPLVLVAVGTDYHPFDRLVGWVDRWLSDAGPERADVLVQYGKSAAPCVATGEPLLNHDALQTAMATAAAVVCHGGPATIMEARRNGRLPICVPRDPNRGEHVDRHQQDFARRIGAEDVVRLAETEEQFRAALDEALDYPHRFALGAESGELTAPGLDRFADLVGELLPPATPDRRVPVMYIGGLGRSGSTLLERCIGQVEQVACVGEVVHLWERGLRDDELCGCGDRFSECAFWQRVGKSAYGGWDKVDIPAVLALKASVDRTRYAPRLLRRPVDGAFGRRLRRYADLLTRLYAAVLDVSGAEVVVDASKHASTALALRAAPGIDLKVLHVVRDSPAVAYAWTKQIARPEAGPGEFMASWSPLRTTMHWTTANMLLDRATRSGTPTRLVRYEDFVRDPRVTLAGILDFVGQDSGDGALDFLDGRTLTLTPSHTVAGNPMRFTNGSLEVVEDNAWRDAFPGNRQRMVTAMTRPLRARYGYTAGSQ